jgi:DNA-3-methyladenine glycosylase II
MRHPIATPKFVERACAHIVEVDPLFSETIGKVGFIRLAPPSSDHFAYLVRAIVYQQLAGAAAATIHGRLIGLVENKISAIELIKRREEEMRSVGISRNKFLAIRDLCERTLSGALPLNDDELAKLPDDDIIDDLSEVRGIGPWTAQMFLLFQLRRLDVWPTGDLGVRRGYGLIHNGDDLSPKELEAAGKILRPYRSVAAVYCWRAIDLAREQRL